ncbi:MAG: STAS domain-containing protein [Pseudonocardiaceae bacterium]
MHQHTDATAGAHAQADPPISLSAREVGDRRLVTIAGEIDMVTTPRLRTFLQQQLEGTGSLLVIDLRAVTFLASSGLAVLVETLSQARERRVGLRLVGDSRKVTRPLEAAGLIELFELYADPDTALASG